MRLLTDTDGLTQQQRDILRTVRDFVDAEVLPVATELDHADAYPDALVHRLRDLGVFGPTIGEDYGGLGEPLLTYALVVEDLSRGRMSLSGIISTHFVVAYLIFVHGTQEKPGLGSDVAAIRTAARREGEDYVITGQKMWVTNGTTANLVALLARTGEGHEEPHRNLTAFPIEKDPGFSETRSRPGLD